MTRDMLQFVVERLSEWDRLFQYAGVLLIGGIPFAESILASMAGTVIGLPIIWIFLSYYPLFFVLIAVGLFIMTRYFTLLEAYRLLANNEVHTRRFSFKLRRKMLKKFDDL